MALKKPSSTEEEFFAREEAKHKELGRIQREQGVLSGLSPKKRGRKAKERNPMARRVAEVERENRKLKKGLEEAQIIIEFQKKVPDVLGIPLGTPPEDDGMS